MRMLIVNPIAGCGYALKVMEQVQSVLTARNLPFRVMRTEYPGCAAKLAREAVEMGCEAVLLSAVTARSARRRADWRAAAFRLG